MKTHRECLTFNIPSRMDFLNITPQVEHAVAKSGVQEGLVLVNAMHITASVFINDNEAGCTRITRNGSKAWPPSMPRRSVITTIARARTTPTPT